MPQKFSNRGRALLQSTINAAATSLSIESAKADRFPIGTTADWVAPADWFTALIEDASGNYEYIKVGTRGGGSGVFSNVLRGQFGSTAQSWTAGAAWVVHGPIAKDFENCLAGMFSSQVTVLTSTAGAALVASGNLAKLSQTNAAGVVTNDRFQFDMATGTLTMADFALTSDERLKSDWKPLRSNFVARLADVLHGTYRRKGSKRREAGVGAASLRELIPQVVHRAKDGTLSVSYAQAAMVAACELAADNVDLRATVVDLEDRLRRLEARLG